MQEQTPESGLDLSIIIVNWNAADYLRGCLETVYRYTTTLRFEIIVVDNASKDDSPTMLREKYPAVTLIANTNNPGFAAANNQGIEIARGRYILLLNPDTELTDDSLGALVNYLDQHPQVGVVGPTLQYPDGGFQGGTAGYDPSPQTLFAYALMLYSIFPRLFRGIWLPRSAFRSQEIAVDWISGACFLIRRSVIDQVGAMNAQIFMYGEDVEWCYRVRMAKWQVVCLSQVKIIHYAGGSAKQRGSGFSRQNVDGLNGYYRLRYSNAVIRLLNWWGFVGFTLRAAAYQVLSWVKRDSDYRRTAALFWACSLASGEHVLYPGKTKP